ncbi:hypothetical protein OS493_017199 [Desmophyllum pertusum]|uniref:EGF-like domain-containing protein n=1 Tax=Desmophyllum pertusum TaxID=174260 RepID=A0A9X0CEF7_9CNID|nr:hypothetical protein OS493_017199 [Desmophyllum pertusum]
MTYEDCVKEANVLNGKCRRDANNSQLTIDITNICDEYQRKLKSLCAAHCAKASCLDCFDKMEEIVESCKMFSKKINSDLNGTVQECEDTKVSLTKHCSSKECQACKDLYCRNGGKCTGLNATWCACPPGYTGAFCQKSKCAGMPCNNSGTCIGENLCNCPLSYSGAQCSTRKRLGTKENPAPNAQAILDAGDSLGSGMYWIQPPGETAPAQTYCDMSFDGGAWMLASYGYVHTTGLNANNKGIPNMNNLLGYAWLPTQRSSSNGLINLPNGAVKMANNARYMIMAAGKNPATGGINEYTYVYRIDLKNNPYNITFSNHNRYNGGQPGRMHVTDFVVEALKGESGTYVRYALGEALGVTWGDSYPTGYGFNDKATEYAVFSKGPFFPSVHSGSGRSPCSGCTPSNYEPDVVGGSPHYTHRGWYTANGVDKTGQTSIWFK